MADISQTQIPHLRQHRLPGLDLGAESIYPAYNGRSILNIPSSVCKLLGVPGIGAEPLQDHILDGAGRRYRRVLLILMDGLALVRLQRWLADGDAPVWKKMLQGGQLAALTSISPSTTSSALTSLWTGRSPLEHGVLGYEMWLKEYGVVANTILHSPITYKDDIGSLSKAGFIPQNFLGHPTFGSHLEAYGVKTYAFQHTSIAHSGLSQMLLQDVSIQPFNTGADLWINVRRMIEQRRHERQYIYVYWGEVDHFSHRYGPDDERVVAEFSQFSHAFERNFLPCMVGDIGRETLVILTADHGQVATPLNPFYDLRNHSALTRRLHIQPTCENRLAFLFTRPGQREAVHEYIQSTWQNQFSTVDSSHAIAAGLFGTGQANPRLDDRCGETIALAHGPAYFWWHDKEDFLLGRHGGLDPDEMLVPFLTSSG